MENVKAYVLANSNLNAKEMSVSEFYTTQEQLNSPVVLFMGVENREYHGHFKIEANTVEELKKMYENKVFYTSDLPEMESEWHYGAYFVGIKPKRKSVQLQLNA